MNNTNVLWVIISLWPPCRQRMYELHAGPDVPSGERLGSEVIDSKGFVTRPAVKHGKFKPQLDTDTRRLVFPLIFFTL